MAAAATTPTTVAAAAEPLTAVLPLVIIGGHDDGTRGDGEFRRRTRQAAMPAGGFESA